MHTPGPWTFTSERPAPDARGVVGPTGVDLWGKAFNDVVPPIEVEGAANARLIAAAPELLAALEQLLGTVRDGGDIDTIPQVELDFYRELIAKVKGGA